MSLTVLISMITALAVSPVLAAWTKGLVSERTALNKSWWHPRRVSKQRLITVACVTAVLAALAAEGTPLPAWWLFAVGGAVLCVIDVEHHLLPARLVYPLAAATAVSLAISAALTGEPDRFIRAVLAAAAVGGGWFLIAFAAPSAMGLGDVRVAALAAGLLGWIGWSAVLAGQLAALGLAVATAGIMTIIARGRSIHAMQVPMGPALIAGGLLVTLF
jgi:leader peptidase (prepilin peptidase)/N-methyltransferase